MPNVKVDDVNHKRLIQLIGELQAKQGRKVYLNEAVGFLLDEHEKREKTK